MSDPVGHISISGVHGRDELNDRLANIKPHRENGRKVGSLALSAAVGAVVMYLLTR